MLFRSCDLLVQDLLAAKKALQLAAFIKKLSRFDALIIDDIGYVQQSREEMEVLFTLLAHRYERGTVMVNSNLPFSEWERIFKDPMTTAAAIDRLVHHSLILELNVPVTVWKKREKAKGVRMNEPGAAQSYRQQNGGLLMRKPVLLKDYKKKSTVLKGGPTKNFFLPPPSPHAGRQELRNGRNNCR